MSKSKNSEQKELFTFDKREPIRGYPELRWAGKRPFTGTSYYPAQLKETYGTETDGWMNKIYWGDNLQVMSHLLKEFRGKVDLIYIDPPFDSKADYKKTISLRGKKAESDTSTFEEKQYGDIWTNDEYLQFMYERLILCRELLSDTGSIYVHMDEKRSHYVKAIMDEVFGERNFCREIIWDIQVLSGYKTIAPNWVRGHDVILFYSNGSNKIFNKQKQPHRQEYLDRFNKTDKDGRKYFDGRGTIVYLDEAIEKGKAVGDVWSDIMSFQQLATSSEKLGYPTQKPEALLERIIKASSNPGDIVFDCFMGSGTTQAVAMKLGRRFLGADINMGAIQTTTKRLINRAKELKNQISDETYYTGFEVYNVNDYEFFRNELEAKRLIIEALGMQALPDNHLWDAELDGRMVAILGINRIATASEFEKIVANMDLAALSRKQGLNPTKPVEKVTFVCMGHDPNLKPMFLEKMESLGLNIDLEIVDLLRDKKDLRFKRESDARVQIVSRQNKRFVEIQSFYPMNLLQKLSIEHQDIEDWRELVDSVLIDWNYDEVTFSPTTLDIPDKKDLVSGKYEVPEGVGRIHVKITDLLSESWEGTIEAS
ncbi:MAG: site-specific DNA-methyltransferase [Proteobacteria bacterium]|nr:site-specific DNA-methyltransferase [Pseudomonadota bacterium]